MSEPSFNVDLSGSLARDVRAAASACGLSVEVYVQTALRREAVAAAEALVRGEDIDADLAAVRDFEQTGEAIPWDEVEAWLRSLTTDAPLPRPTARRLR